MSKIEAIIVDGVRYDKVKSMVDDVCEECELREVCEDSIENFFAFECKTITNIDECWKRKEE